MEAFFTSLGLVALAEIGDKTQLLAILLSFKFRKPLPIIAGIFAATIVNHALAAAVGSVAADFLSGRWFQIAIGVSFVAMGLWTLIPDKLDDEEKVPRYGPFVATTIAFFLVEMGDKTQVATIALGARFHDVLLVAAGTTAGMMVANVPAVLLGNQLLQRVPMQLVHRAAALLFLAIGAWTLWVASR